MSVSPAWPVARVAIGCLLPFVLLAAPEVRAAGKEAAQDDAPPAATSTTTDPQPGAAPARANGPRTYDAAWFAPFAPATALQIVQRVPGFSIEQIDPSLRGFGQAAGNVVINGQRPSAKSDTIQTILSRIPASRVLRVEVGQGDLFGAEFTGKAQVLNVVTTATGGLAGSLAGTVRRDFTGRLLPEGTASALLKRGNSTFNLALTVQNQDTTEEGFDRVTALPSGDLLEYRRKVNTIRDPAAALSGSWEYNGGTNRTAHLNGRIGIDRFRLDQANRVTVTGVASREDALHETYDTDQYELGGDVTRPFAGGGLKLIGLATRQKRDNLDVSLVDLSDPTGATQRLRDELSETLLRVTWTRAGWNGWTVEGGAEGVINQLRSRVDLFDLGLGGVRTRVDLPVDDATVREVRGEAFVNAGHALSPTMRVDMGLTVEASRLTVSGDVSAARTLSFLKPKFVLDWRPDQKWHAQLTLQRTVNQLQFTDFISTAELSNDRVNGGNPDLVPQRAWELTGTLERPILGDGLARLEAGWRHISMVQDRVPTPEGFDAPGNLGDGDVLILRARLEAPLKTLGVKGGRLTLYGSLVPTYVRDPYTFRIRPFTGNSLFYGSAEFRQDLGSFAWGFTLEANTPATAYRRDELDKQFQQIYGQAFAEWRPTKTSVVTFTLENALQSVGARDRRFFLPDRRTAEPYLREERRRNRHTVPALTFKHTFG